MADKMLDTDYDTINGGITVRGSVATGITNITAANPAVVTVANDFVNGDEVIFDSVAGMTEINDRHVTVSSASATAFTTDLNTSSGFTSHSGSAGQATIVQATSNQIRVIYDDTKSKHQIVDALQRAKEKLTQTLAP